MLKILEARLQQYMNCEFPGVQAEFRNGRGTRDQYASKFGKLSSGHRTGKGRFSFQSQRKAMPKNIQTTEQLHPSHMLAK